MHDTRHDLALKTRKKVIEILQEVLTELIDASMTIRQCHWSVRGPQFIMLHELFGEIYESLSEPIDDVAERIAQLGGLPRGTTGFIAKQRTQGEVDAGLLDAGKGREHIEAVASTLSVLAKRVRTGIDETTDLKDAVSADLLTGLGGELDKKLWLVESHLQGGM
jgi:starvation-inducible DNA-binding protein